MPQHEKDVVYKVQAKNLAFEDIFKELFPGRDNEMELWEVVLENYREYAKMRNTGDRGGA